MNKVIFICMVGLPCSGKSTMAQQISKQYNANIHSSDAIREELTGDITNQEHSNEVFQILHKRIKEDLCNGKSCIYDACNIHSKERMAFLKEIEDISCKKICVIMATPYEICIERSQKRERKVPESVIRRMYMRWNSPYWYEGWDDIQIVYSENAEGSYGDTCDWIKSVWNYDQHNSHHLLTLGEHCSKAFQYLYLCPLPFWEIRTAALIHDCGKVKTATYFNTKGEKTKECHYYNHENCGAYDSLFFRDIEDYLYVAQLIQNHMRPFVWKQSEKAMNKDRKLWGEKIFQGVCLLHEVDLAAH